MKWYFNHRPEYLNVFSELCTYSANCMPHSSDWNKGYISEHSSSPSKIEFCYKLIVYSENKLLCQKEVKVSNNCVKRSSNINLNSYF